MKSGYKILWTDHALIELKTTIEYLETNFSKREIEKLSQKIESIISLISQNPALFPKSDKKGVYRVTILKFNTMYYRIQNDSIEILLFFSNRQSPKKEKYKNLAQQKYCSKFGWTIVKYPSFAILKRCL